MRTSTYQHPLWWPSIWSFWTICVEQPPHRTPPVWSLSGTVPPSAGNVFVLTGSAAPSDCLLLGGVYKFAYLLTYLHCRVLPLGEFSVMIPEPHVTLQGVRIPSAILKIVFRHILFYFCFLNAVWALTSGRFRIVSDTLVLSGTVITSALYKQCMQHCCLNHGMNCVITMELLLITPWSLPS